MYAHTSIKHVRNLRSTVKYQNLSMALNCTSYIRLLHNLIII